MNESIWWSREQAAIYTNMSPKTLANRHSDGTGPETRKTSPGRSGKIYYKKEWLDEWIMNHGVMPIRYNMDKPVAKAGRKPKIR